jgi:hypothetical protein
MSRERRVEEEGDCVGLEERGGGAFERVGRTVMNSRAEDRVLMNPSVIIQLRGRSPHAGGRRDPPAAPWS